MPRQFKTGKKNRTNYIYYTSDGERIAITPGKDGVTETDIERLHALDDDEVDEQRRYDYRVPARYDAFPLDLGAVNSYCAYLLDSGADPVEILSKKEAADTFARAMENLLFHQRALFEQVYVEKRSLASIAAEEGVTEGAIRHRLSRLHARLKKFYEKS